MTLADIDKMGKKSPKPKSSSEISFVQSVPYDFAFIPIGLFVTGILGTAFAAFYGVSVALVPIAVFAAVFSYFVARHNKINEVADKLPHEVIDNFMLWEEGDEIRLGVGSNHLSLFYQGVLESGLLVFERERDGGEQVLSARVFRFMRHENKSLRRRRAEDVRTDKVGGNYRKFVQSAQQELQSLTSDSQIDTDGEWNRTSSKTSESQKSTRASETG